MVLSKVSAIVLRGSRLQFNISVVHLWQLGEQCMYLTQRRPFGRATLDLLCCAQSKTEKVVSMKD